MSTRALVQVLVIFHASILGLSSASAWGLTCSSIMGRLEQALQVLRHMFECSGPRASASSLFHASTQPHSCKHSGSHSCETSGLHLFEHLGQRRTCGRALGLIRASALTHALWELRLTRECLGTHSSKLHRCSNTRECCGPHSCKCSGLRASAHALSCKNSRPHSCKLRALGIRECSGPHANARGLMPACSLFNGSTLGLTHASITGTHLCKLHRCLNTRVSALGLM